MKRDIYCVVCGSPTAHLGQAAVQVTYEGVPEGHKLHFCQWMEEPVDCRCAIDIYRCKKCGHLEIYDPNFTLPQEKA
jgi:hypothetical protein